MTDMIETRNMTHMTDEIDSGFIGQVTETYFFFILKDHPEMFLDLQFMITNKRWWTPELFINNDNIIMYTVLDAVFRPYWENILHSMYFHFQAYRPNMWIPAEFTKDDCLMQINLDLDLQTFIEKFKIPDDIKDAKYIPYVKEIEDLIKLYKSMCEF